MRTLLTICLLGLTFTTSQAAKLRGGWWSINEEHNGTTGTNEINSALNLAQAAKLNTLFFWSRSGYIEHVDTDHHWDYLPAVNTACAARGITNYLWFGPFTDKLAPWHIELRDHPEWAEIHSDTSVSTDAICPTRDEVRAFEIAAILALMDRYPALAGVDLSEPGVRSTSYCYCSVCTDYLTAHSMNRTNLYADRVGAFVSELRTALNARGKKLTCDGGIYVSWSSDRRMGRDWGQWATNQWIDWYMPQDYTYPAAQFIDDGTHTKPMVTGAGYIPGIGIQYTGGGGWTTNTVEVVGGQAQAAMDYYDGFSLFRIDHMDTNYTAAIAATYTADAGGGGGAPSAITTLRVTGELRIK